MLMTYLSFASLLWSPDHTFASVFLPERLSGCLFWWHFDRCLSPGAMGDPGILVHSVDCGVKALITGRWSPVHSVRWCRTPRGRSRKWHCGKKELSPAIIANKSMHLLANVRIGLSVCVTHKRWVSWYEDVADDTQGPHVGAGADKIVAHYFRCYKFWCSTQSLHLVKYTSVYHLKFGVFRKHFKVFNLYFFLDKYEKINSSNVRFASSIL